MTAVAPLGRPSWRFNCTLTICMGISLALCGFVARLFYWPAGDGLDVHHYQLGRDFINNWAGPRIAWSGRVQTLFDLDAYARAIGVEFGRPLPFHNWGYPPFALVLFWPLAQLPYFWALAVWTAGSFAAFAWMASRLAEPGRRGAMVLALAVAPACLINAIGGQNGFVTGALLLGAMLWLDRRPLLAGVLIGLLTLKPQLGLILPFVLIALRKWPTIAAACATAAVLVATSIAAFGLEPWIRYVTETSGYQVSLLRQPHGFYIYMMVSALAQLRLAGVAYGPALLIQGALSLAVAIAAVWAVLRTPDPRLRACVIVLATPLITPYAFNYDLTALTACVTWRMMSCVQDGAGLRLLAPLAWLAPIAGMVLSIGGVALAPVVLAAVFVLSLRWVAQDRLAVRDGDVQAAVAPPVLACA